MWHASLWASCACEWVIGLKAAELVIETDLKWKLNWQLSWLLNWQLNWLLSWRVTNRCNDSQAGWSLSLCSGLHYCTMDTIAGACAHLLHMCIWGWPDGAFVGHYNMHLEAHVFMVYSKSLLISHWSTLHICTNEYSQVINSVYVQCGYSSQCLCVHALTTTRSPPCFTFSFRVKRWVLINRAADKGEAATCSVSYVCLWCMLIQFFTVLHLLSAPL